MGRVKAMMMEQEDGLMHSFEEDKNVCANHFKDSYLQTYINSSGHSGECSYCGKTHKKVLSMKVFMDFVKSKLAQGYVLWMKPICLWQVHIMMMRTRKFWDSVAQDAILYPIVQKDMKAYRILCMNIIFILQMIA